MNGFLNKRRITKEALKNGSTYNFISMNGGKFNIGSQDKSEFFDLFTETPLKELPSLVFKAFDRVGPVYIDIDILTKDKFDQNTDILHKATEIAYEEIKNMAPSYEINVSISARPKPYKKEIKSKNLKGFAYGGHIIFHGWFTKNFCMELYDRLSKNIALKKLLEGSKSLTPFSEILDKSPLTRSNGLCLVNVHKPKNFNPPHQLILCECVPNESVRITTQQMEILYDWLFEQPESSERIYDYARPQSKIGKHLGVKPPKPLITKSRTRGTPRLCLDGESTFNLPLFLKLTNTHVPSNEEWKQLCVYFASEKLCPEYVAQLTNEAWKPENPNETADFMRKLTYYNCTIGSAINYLNLYAGEEWDLDKVFGKNRQCFKFYNEITQFTLAKGDVWTLGVINQFFQDVFVWVHGDASFRFIYKEQKISNTYKKKFMQVNTCVVTDSPFLGIANLTINCHQSRASLLKKLEKVKRPKKMDLPDASSPELCCLRKKLEKKQKEAQSRYQKAQVLLALEEDAYLGDIRDCLGDVAGPVQRKVNDLFMAYHNGRYMRSFHSFTYKPYTEKDPTPQDTFNLFTGFPLSKYRNTNVDIHGTAIYTWIWHALANQRQWKLDYLFNYFASKLQSPTDKIKKFLLIYGDLTGTGKTSIRYFCQALYSIESVRFCENTKQYEDKFNCLSLGRMFCIVDDIDRWSKTQTDNLKSKITSDTFEYRKMRMDPVVMPSFEDLICTSNNRDTYIGHNDRRSELIVINPCLKATNEDVPEGFTWKQYYEELQDVEIMGAWFEFLASRDISKVHFNEGYRFSEESLFEQKLRSIHTAHAFLLEYFEKSHFWMTKEYSPLQLSHLIRCMTTKNGERVMWVDTKVLYSWYQLWVTQNGRRVKVHSINFKAQLADIGIHSSRITWKLGRCTMFKICGSEVIRGIANRYEIPKEMITIQWQHLDMIEDNWGLFTEGNFGSLQFGG